MERPTHGRLRGIVCVMFAGLAGVSSAQAQGADSSGGLDIVYGGTIETRLKSDQTLNKTGDVKPFDNTFGEVEAEWYANFGRYFSLNGKFILEQVRAVERDSFFREEALYTDQLYGTLNFDPVRVYGGKIHPHFGRAWDKAPGLYGTDFAEDYEIVEKIGVGVGYDIRAYGLHTLSFESFFADTSFLSNSVFTRPEAGGPNVLRPKRLAREDGGVSNTGRLDNFAVSLEGGRIPDMHGFGYTLGYLLQQASNETERDEKSWVVGTWWEFPIGTRMEFVPFFEFANQTNRQGTDQNANYYTLGLEFGLGGGWTATAFGTLRDLSGSETLDNTTDHLIGLSLMHDLTATILRGLAQRAPVLRGITLEVGYKHERVTREDLNTIGFELKWGRSF